MKRRAGGLGLAAMVAGAGLAMTTVGAHAATAAGDTAVVYRGELHADGTVTQSQSEVPVTTRDTPGGDKPGTPTPQTRPANKLDPRLAAAARSPAAAGGRQQVVVTFRQDLKVPRFPVLDPDLPRTAAANTQALATANGMVADLTARRRAGYQAISADLARLGVRTLDTYWLMKGMVVDAPNSALAALAQRADVSYVQPVVTREPPPDSEPGNDEFFARYAMRTDGFYNLGQTSGYIGILDTGVRSTHTLFNNPSKPWIREDLVHPSSPNPEDDWPDGGHGTSTAAILTGNSNLGDRFHGVTGITVDSFKVYDTVGLNSDAAVKGFQRSVQVLDRVVVAEIQYTIHDYEGIATAADQAFDAGAVVIAANGNHGLSDTGVPVAGSVDSPALAQKVLGIGAIDVMSGETQGYESRGPTADGRTKPDLQAPTNVETASNAGDTATRVFGGTSAATPHAAGAAALIRNYLRGSNFDIDPASVYAFMLAAGSNFNGSSILPPVDNTIGVGPVRLPEAPTTWQSSANTVGNQETLSLPITVKPSSSQLKVAIWWPEPPDTHDDIDLAIYDPSGTFRGGSASFDGVFERASVVGPMAAGNWTVQVRGYNVPSGAQRVHMVALNT
jgi:serine protease AprX